MAEQLAFDLPVRPALGREAFFVSPANGAALRTLEDWKTWPGQRQLLVGPPGSGKTHLAHVWAAISGARIISAAALSLDAVPGLVEADALVVEDADQGANEAALFHLLNLAQAEGTALLLTAAKSPTGWGTSLPDLSSRLSAMPLARLHPPDDPLLAAVLVKLFGDRQLVVNPRLIGYLATRIERSFEAARQVVSRLDAAALESGRPLNLGLAADVLDQLETPHA